MVIDADDCERLARFWSEALGWRITYESVTEWCIEPPEGSPEVDVAPDILFVKVPDRKVVKNRLHFDLRPADQQAQVRRLLELGAIVPTSANPTTRRGSSWPIRRGTSSARPPVSSISRSSVKDQVTPERPASPGTRHKAVRRGGLEPPTRCLEGSRSVH